MEVFMKKFVFVLALGALVSSAAIFAESGDKAYVVDKVIGKVECEVSAGKWEAVTGNMKLDPSSVISTGLNSSVVLKSGDRVLTIKAMQKGTVDQLVSQLASSKTTIKLGSKVTTSDATADNVQARTNISTASTRASDATKDIEWVEE
jgi:hypothetical protein